MQSGNAVLGAFVLILALVGGAIFYFKPKLDVSTVTIGTPAEPGEAKPVGTEMVAVKPLAEDKEKGTVTIPGLGQLEVMTEAEEAALIAQAKIDRQATEKAAAEARERAAKLAEVMEADRIPDTTLEPCGSGAAAGIMVKGECHPFISRKLTLNRVAVSDLSFLREMTALEELTLSDMPVSDLGPVAQLSGLKKLWLRDLPVSDISPLAGLTQLKKLMLEDLEVSDISALSGMTDMRDLFLRFTPITDISVLAGMTEMRHLELERIEIADISPLRGLVRIEKLVLSRLPVSDISALSGMIELRTIDLSETEVSDLTPLAGAKRMMNWSFKKSPADGQPLPWKD